MNPELHIDLIGDKSIMSYGFDIENSEKEKLASGINNLRNHYGSGYGRERNFKALSKKHAELSVVASKTLTIYLWDSFREIENSNNL